MAYKFKSVDCGGRSIRYVCKGTGIPAVVIDQGQGLSIERSFERSVPIGWGRVFIRVQESVQVVMHDRAGLGSSDPAPAPRTSSQMVDDLRVVLAEARVPSPYVLVGHSVGGFNVRVFAGRYPDEAAGMVLVDSSHPDQISRLAEIVPPEAPGEPPPLRLLRRGPDATQSTEHIDFGACAEQARKVATIGSRPLVVVSQSPRALAPPGIPVPVWERMQPAWSKLQADLMRLSGESTHMMATHAGHMVQLEEPDLVIEAILHVVHAVRLGMRRLH
ncbi:MAG TPA: alpha/beta hydrolase [Steroidobacteraceae bacterium]|nr:alpha/beta hydrolase [Steroidobacteraceae bacterium]